VGNGQPAVSEGEVGVDDEWLARARAGEASAFTPLVKVHQRMVYSLALRMLSDRQLAEDLAQDVFLQLFRSLSSVESGAHLKFWLRRVTVNKAIDRLRRQPPREGAPLEEAEAIAGDGSHGDPLLERRLRSLIGKLPAAPRAVVLLRFQEDLDPKDIARILNMSLNTVKSHLRRSLQALRERLGDTRVEGPIAPLTAPQQRSPI
jgi:RNA polymerase sigma-70 factor, ECF subfamily